MPFPIASRFVVAVLFTLALASTGCKRQPTDASAAAPGATVVALGGTDINTDGTLSPKALQQIEQHASDARLNLTFVRASLSDAGLAQLSKFHNLRHIDAVGSRITAAGIQRLKTAIPDIEVSH